MIFFQKKIVSYLFLLISFHAISVTKKIDGIVAIVGDDVILSSEIEDKLQKREELKNEKDQDVLSCSFSSSRILDRSIKDKIVSNMLLAYSSLVKEDEIDRIIKDIAKQNQITVEQMYGSLTKNKKDYFSYRKTIRAEVIFSKLFGNEMMQKISIFPEEIRSFIRYNSFISLRRYKYYLRHFFIPFKDKKYQTMDVIRSWKQKIEKYKFCRQPFINYIFRNQEVDIQGIIWMLTKQETSNFFSRYLKNARIGDTVGPIRTINGLHIFVVDDIQDESVGPRSIEVKIKDLSLYFSQSEKRDQVHDRIIKISQKIKKNKRSFSILLEECNKNRGLSGLERSFHWNYIQDFDYLFQNKILSMEKGEISDPFRSSYGWHIIQLIDLRKSAPWEETQKKLASKRILFRKLQEEQDLWIQEKLSSSFIKVIDEKYQK